MRSAESGAAGRLRFHSRLGTVFSVGVLVSLAVGGTYPACAEDNGWIDRFAAGYTAGRADKDSKADKLASGPLFAVVSIADQRISLYGSGGLVARAPVSTGVRGHATPTGVFSIVQKRRWHESNIYSSAPMPFMQRITWSGIALHEGVVPGHPASHGCIRLPGSFAQRLFGATEIGQRVMVVPWDAVPVEITHKTLPAPRLSPAPALSASNAPDATVAAPRQIGGAVLEPTSLHDGQVRPTMRLNPLEVAQAMRAEASNKAKAAGRASHAAMLLITKRNTELRVASKKLSMAENATQDAEADLIAAVRRLEKQDGKEAIAEAVEAKDEAVAALAEVQKAKDMRIAKAAEALARTETALGEAQKARDTRIAEAAETRTRAEAILAEAQNAAQETRIVEATEAKSKAEDLFTAVQKAEERRIAGAEEAKSEAQTALAKVQKAEELRLAEAMEAESEAQAALIEAHNAEGLRITKAIAAKSHADAALTEAEKALTEARIAKDAKDQELAAARGAAAEAKAAGNAASQVLAEATRRSKPLSVFISRKTSRLYVRQNFEPLFDVPVSIRDADRDIGTHLYVSTRAAEDGSMLYWQAVTTPVSSETEPARHKGKGREASADPVSGTEIAGPLAQPETALGALDRVMIPEDTSRRLEELAWIGASVIISDYGISGETGSTTDFIILTRSKARTR